MPPKDNPHLALPRRHLLYGAVTLAACSLLTECGYRANSNSTSSSGTPPAVPLTTGLATLTVTSNAAGTIPPRFMGLSYEKAAMSYPYFHASNHNLIALFRLLGAGVLRIGGGSVDEVMFLAEGIGGHKQVTPANIAALADFLKQTGWLCIYGVNFATSTPALAAQEAACVVSALGPCLLGFEIGNEPDEYSIAGLFFVGDWTFQDFFTRWSTFRAAIVQAAPNAPITGPATGGGNHITTWTLPFGQAASHAISLLTQHYYRASGGSPGSTASFLISADPQLVGDLAILNAGAQQMGLPYRISECNSFYNGGAAGVSNSYASSLWVLDFLFTAAANNAAGVNLHGGGNQPGYTPIADDAGGVIEARPEYYGLLFFTLAGAGTLLQTQLSVGNVNVTAYAVKTTTGSLCVMIVNKDVGEDLTITIQTNQHIQAANMQLMSGPGLAATSGVIIQGATVNKDGSFAPVQPLPLIASGSQTTCQVPALSAALISIT